MKMKRMLKENMKFKLDQKNIILLLRIQKLKCQFQCLMIVIYIHKSN